MKEALEFTLNGKPARLDVDPQRKLLWVLRDDLGLTGSKYGCGEGLCGACTVVVNGQAVRSCSVLVSSVDGAEVITIEGLGHEGALHPLQQAFVDHFSAQCGFCTPGFVVSTKALLDQNPNPSREDVRDWFQVHRNACRCTGYKMIVDAVMDSAKVLQGKMRIGDLEFKMPADGRIWGTTYPRPSAM